MKKLIAILACLTVGLYISHLLLVSFGFNMISSASWVVLLRDLTLILSKWLAVATLCVIVLTFFVNIFTLNTSFFKKLVLALLWVGFFYLLFRFLIFAFVFLIGIFVLWIGGFTRRR